MIFSPTQGMLEILLLVIVFHLLQQNSNNCGVVQLLILPLPLIYLIPCKTEIDCLKNKTKREDLQLGETAAAAETEGS
jgi:hypothetical protein